MFIAKLARFVFWAVLSVCLLMPFSNDIFISGFPAMSKHFVNCNISLIISMFFLGSAIAQPVYGPLSDRFGRRPILLIGLLIYTLASAQVMFTDNFTLMIVGRFFQAIGACSATISVLAIIRDRYAGDKIVVATSFIVAVIGAGPAVAPLFGSLLNAAWGWRTSFVFLFVLGVAYLVLVKFGFHETLVEKNIDAIKPRVIIGNYFRLVRHLGFMTYSIIGGVVYGIFFVYFSLSPLFLMQQLHYQTIQYGLIVALNGLAIVVVARLAPSIVKKFSMNYSIYIGFGAILLAGITMWLINLFAVTDVYTFMGPMLLATMGIGVVRSSASAAALQLVESKIAGSAAALFNSMSFVCGAVATAIAPEIIDRVAMFGLFIVVVMVGTVLLVSGLFLSRRNVFVNFTKGESHE